MSMLKFAKERARNEDESRVSRGRREDWTREGWRVGRDPPVEVLGEEVGFCGSLIVQCLVGERREMNRASRRIKSFNRRQN